MVNLVHRPLLLLVLDGWGYSQTSENNAISLAHKPNFDRLWLNYPHTLLSASGLDVGLPPGQMGNSEVGHLHIGAGKVTLQELTKIDLAVENKSFFKNSVLNQAIDDTIASDSALHVLGLLSDGGIHSRNTHLEALLELAANKGLKKVFIHAFLDGRDTPQKSAKNFILSMQEKINTLKTGAIASIIGRYYAMDRDKRWDRVEKTYQLLVSGTGEYHFADPITALEAAYERGETDEFVKPTVIDDTNHPITIADQDTVIFMNFRADRARELSYALTASDFDGFNRTPAPPKLKKYVTLTSYATDLKAEAAYPNEELNNLLGEIIANQELSQLRIAETEKYAHVTYFLNGGIEEPLVKEDRILIPSPKVSTYDKQPEMSVFEVTEQLTSAIRSQKYDFIVCNYANPDMVGHTGNLEATVKAIETIDSMLGKVEQGIKEAGGEIIIIADHGNAEKMLDETNGQPCTTHTSNPVPFIYVGRAAAITKDHGSLIDIAPTILYLMKIAQPKEMTGKSLLELTS